jgi:hypothetical protein
MDGLRLFSYVAPHTALLIGLVGACAVLEARLVDSKLQLIVEDRPEVIDDKT